jgi:hypothetical protein
MGFKVNFSKANSGNGIKPEGWYECIIAKIEERQTKNGAWGLNFSFVIRNDVDQQYKNGYIFHTIWRKREPSTNDMAVKGYNFGQLMAIARVTKFTDGKEYETLEDLCKEMLNKPIRIELYHDEYNGKKQERVKDFAETAFPECRHVFKTAAPAADTYAAPVSQGFAVGGGDMQVFGGDSGDDGIPF